MIDYLFSIPRIGQVIKQIVVSIEGGAKASISLRKYTSKKQKVEVGLFSYGSCFSREFNTGGTVEIGKYCSFGPNVRYFGANHPIEKAVMSPFYYNKKFGGFDVQDVVRNHLCIGNDVWIGANVIILPNCHTIGNGAVIGAGTIVTRDVPAYGIVVGNPGHLIKYRFNEDTIKSLEESEWWNYSPRELFRFYNTMKKPKKFAEDVKKLAEQRK